MAVFRQCGRSAARTGLVIAFFFWKVCADPLMSKAPILDPAQPSRAIAALQDWSSMAAGAFAANTVRAWRADWESRGVTVGDLRDVVNPSLETAGKTSCFSRRGDHPPSLRSTRNKHNGHEAVDTGVIRSSTIAGDGPL